jgi:osmoprotectant transport system substrate-binding protein
MRVAGAVAAWLVLPLLLGACTGEVDAPRRVERPSAVVEIASFDFPESQLIAEIYAQALVDAGVPVRREPRLGPRELVQPALQQGLVDLVPEYLGAALSAVAPHSSVDRHDPVATRKALDTALAHWGLRTLVPSAATNQNALVVSRVTARNLGLRTISDLRGEAPLLTIGVPPECPRREYCLPALSRVYGLRFGAVTLLDTETQRVAALREGVIDVALLFTTDGSLASEDVVMLGDDRSLQPAENVVPVVSERALRRHGDRLSGTLDEISKQLTSENLRFLNWRVEAGHDIAAEARGWLLRHGLLTRPD